MGDIFNAVFRSEKAMRKKADAVRKALIEGASSHRLAQATVNRARKEHPDIWLRCAITQLASILGITRINARVLISEHCDVKTN